MQTKKDLEKRIAALEQEVESGKKIMAFIIETWQGVLLDFAESYNLATPELREISNQIKQRE